MWGTFGSVPTIFGILPNVVEDTGLPLERFPNIGRLPLWLARCQILKKSQTEALRGSAMRGVPLHVYYIHFSQCAHPMGSGRPPWAAGELNYDCHVAR